MAVPVLLGTLKFGLTTKAHLWLVHLSAVYTAVLAGKGVRQSTLVTTSRIVCITCGDVCKCLRAIWSGFGASFCACVKMLCAIMKVRPSKAARTTRQLVTEVHCSRDNFSGGVCQVVDLAH